MSKSSKCQMSNILYISPSPLPFCTITLLHMILWYHDFAIVTIEMTSVLFKIMQRQLMGRCDCAHVYMVYIGTSVLSNGFKINCRPWLCHKCMLNEQCNVCNAYYNFQLLSLLTIHVDGTVSSIDIIFMLICIQQCYS